MILQARRGHFTFGENHATNSMEGVKVKEYDLEEERKSENFSFILKAENCGFCDSVPQLQAKGGI